MAYAEVGGKEVHVVGRHESMGGSRRGRRPVESPVSSPCAPCPRSGGSALPWPASPHPSSAGCAAAPRYAGLLGEQGDPSAPHQARGPPTPPSRCAPLTAAVSGRFQLLNVLSLPLQLQIRFMQLLPVDGGGAAAG